jgi:hypothetical protein
VTTTAVIFTSTSESTRTMNQHQSCIFFQASSGVYAEPSRQLESAGRRFGKTTARLQGEQKGLRQNTGLKSFKKKKKKL